MLAWTAFICVFMFVMLCINAIIRKQWTERERLTYPLTHLPYEMANPKSGLLKNKLLWTSFTVVCIIDIMNGLHTFYPVVPSFQLRAYNLGKFFTTKPWDAIGYMALLVRPFLLGLIFLVPLDISFSCWVFFFFWKAQLVLGEAWGFQNRPEFPEQSAGAYIALSVIAIWTGRHHFSRVIRSIWDRRLAGDSEREALPYNVAVYGVIAGFLFIVVFCWQAGMTWWGAAMFFALLLMTNIGVTRIRAEVGSALCRSGNPHAGCFRYAARGPTDVVDYLAFLVPYPGTLQRRDASPTRRIPDCGPLTDESTPRFRRDAHCDCRWHRHRFLGIA